MASPPLHVDDLSFSDLDLITTPPAGASSNKHTRPTTRPSFKPAAVGARPSVAGGASSQSQQANLRLLQGVNKPPPMAAANRAGGGGNKRRTSLFVPSALPKANSSAADDADESAAVEQGEGEGDDSLLEAMKSSKPREPALPTLPASFHQQRPTRGANAAADEEAEGAGGEGDSETKEQVQRQLDDLSKMNSSFEAYERMLQGTVGQIDVSAREPQSRTCCFPTDDLIRCIPPLFLALWKSPRGNLVAPLLVHRPPTALRQPSKPAPQPILARSDGGQDPTRRSDARLGGANGEAKATAGGGRGEGGARTTSQRASH